jgi:hypothetical protein
MARNILANRHDGHTIRTRTTARSDLRLLMKLANEGETVSYHFKKPRPWLFVVRYSSRNFLRVVSVGDASSTTAVATKQLDGCAFNKPNTTT